MIATHMAHLAVREVCLALGVAEAVSLLAVHGNEPAIATACLAYLAAYRTALSVITLLKSRQ